MHVAFPLTVNSTMSLRYRLRTDDVLVASNLCIPGSELVSVVLCDERGSFLTSSFGYSVRLDKRNDPQIPTRGFDLDLSQDVAGFGGNVNWVRTEWNAGWYHGFNKDFVLSLTTKGGYIDGWNGGNCGPSNGVGVALADGVPDATAVVADETLLAAVDRVSGRSLWFMTAMATAATIATVTTIAAPVSTTTRRRRA